MSALAARVLLLAAGLAASREAVAQTPGLRGVLVTAAVQPETLTVGQPFTVRIRVRAPKIATIRFPPVPDSADAIEAVDPRSVEDTPDDVVLDRTGIYRLVAWDVGRHRPHFGNVVVSAAGADQSFAVGLDPVIVRSTLPVDSASRIPKDALDPVPPPSGLWRYALLGGLALVAILWYLLRRMRRRARAPRPDPEAFATATKAFSAVEALGLVEAGEPGRHVIAHVDVLRRYIARRFPAVTESLTAREVLAALGTSDLPVPPERVGELLERDAAVRFAQGAINADTALALAREARTIVQDVQTAHEARQRALDRAPSRQRRARAR